MLVENRQEKEVILFYLGSKVIFSTSSSTSHFFLVLFNLLEVEINITTGKTVQLQNLLTPLLLHTPNLS